MKTKKIKRHFLKNKNEEYIFYKNKEQWVHLPDGKEFKLAKMVYSTFVDTNLNAFNPFWDIDYIDGNPDNCASFNLKRKY